MLKRHFEAPVGQMNATEGGGDVSTGLFYNSPHCSGSGYDRMWSVRERREAKKMKLCCCHFGLKTIILVIFCCSTQAVFMELLRRMFYLQSKMVEVFCCWNQHLTFTSWH